MYANSDKSATSFKNKKGYGINLKTGEFGDMIKMGIVDPTLVTKSALKNAVSVASTILSTKTVVHHIQEPASQIISAKKLWSEKLP